MSDRLPRVELLVAGPAPEQLRLVLRQLRRWCALSAADSGLGPPAARLATSVHALGLDRAVADAACPVAVWVGSQLDADVPLVARARVAFGPPGVRPPEPVEMIAVPVDVVDAGTTPLTPYVRSRWRRRFGLPDELVVDLASLDDDVGATAMRLASVAVVDRRRALEALALGTPVVTDAATASWLGAVDGEHLVVADGTDARAVADVLAADGARAARIGRLGRRLVEQHHDVAVTARRLASALDLVGLGRIDDPIAVLGDRLAELGTPTGASAAGRAYAAVASLGPATITRWVR